LYALHPAVVHFPIALLLLNLLLTLRYLWVPDSFTERAAYGALALGWWATLAGVTTGTIAVARDGPLRSDVLIWVNWHAALGLALLIVYGRALLLRRRNPALLDGPGRRRYLVMIIAGAGIVAIDGWIGGHLVYQLGLGVK
jgi:uncharacterized membrane protein